MIQSTLPELETFKQLMSERGLHFEKFTSKDIPPEARVALMEYYGTVQSRPAKANIIAVFQVVGTPDEREAYFRMMSEETDPRSRGGLAAGLVHRVLPEDYGVVLAWMLEAAPHGHAAMYLESLGTANPERAIADIEALDSGLMLDQKFKERVLTKLRKKMERTRMAAEKRTAREEARRSLKISENMSSD